MGEHVFVEPNLSGQSYRRVNRPGLRLNGSNVDELFSVRVKMNGLLFGAVVFAIVLAGVAACFMSIIVMCFVVGMVIFIIRMIVFAVIIVYFVFIVAGAVGFRIALRTVTGLFLLNASIFFVSGKYTGCRY
jgi:hypothetical protein